MIRLSNYVISIAAPLALWGSTAHADRPPPARVAQAAPADPAPAPSQGAPADPAPQDAPASDASGAPQDASARDVPEAPAPIAAPIAAPVAAPVAAPGGPSAPGELSDAALTRLAEGESIEIF